MKAPIDTLQHGLRMYRDGRTNEAEALFRTLILRNAEHHRAMCALGILLAETGNLDESLHYLERAVQLEPNPQYLTNLGEVYRRQGRLDMAAESFGRILEIDPDYPDGRLNLAAVLAEVGVQRETLELLEEAVTRGPDSPRLRATLAAVLMDMHRLEEALVHVRRCVDLAPKTPAAHRQLADVLDAMGEKADALTSYRRAVALNPDDYRNHSSLIVAMLAMPDFDARAHLAEARAWATRHAEPLRKYQRPHSNDRDPERQLRIGYVSADFRAHPIHHFLAPVLECHDASAFEVYLYSSARRVDEQTAWYAERAGTRFRDVRRLDDVAVADLVRSDAIDILVDLSLHTQGGRLRTFACRPAPVQISWLGYLGTTGLDTIDFRLTDPFVDPPSSDLGVYSETCLHLPETLWCYSALGSDQQAGPLPALDAGHVTFGCQNTYRKQHRAVFALWAKVLREVPTARLFLHAEDYACAGVLEIFMREGISADRIDFGGRTSHLEYLRRYQRIDIGLDTFPFNGATTTLDAAWMGVPVVSLSGPSAMQRAGLCIASNLGMPGLAPSSEDGFVATAVELAGDLERLRELRTGLRARLEASPLGDSRRFTRNLEAAYREAWHRYTTPR